MRKLRARVSASSTKTSLPLLTFREATKNNAVQSVYIYTGLYFPSSVRKHTELDKKELNGVYRSSM
jgi:hypothetical protein